MAAAAQTVPAAPSAIAWLRDFLREELAPYPGRGAMVARMSGAAILVILLTMTFQVPFGAVAAFFTLLISRESPDATVKAAGMLLTAFAAAAVFVLLGAVFFSGEPLLRLAWVTLCLFLMFFLLSALSNYAAGLQFGVLIALTIPLWDQHVPSENKVENTLWAVGAMSIATLVTTAVELIYSRLQPHGPITISLTRRLAATSSLLRSWLEGIQDKEAEKRAERFGILGTSRMRRDLQRAGFATDYGQRMGALVALTGRLVELALALGAIAPGAPPPLDAPERVRLLRLTTTLEAMVDRLLNRDAPLHPLAVEGAGSSDRVPLLAQMEWTADRIIEIIGGAEAPNFLTLPPIESEKAHHGFFLPDAFSNPRHLRFAIRGGLAALACYVIYSLVDWPGLSTSVLTCFVTALTTIGASRQKQVLRFAGTFIGGVILGFGAQVFILPGIDSITGFLLLLAAVTVASSWIAVAGPRLSYFGVQVALSFYFINLEEFKFQTSLSIARDRVFGVLLGLVMMWLIFDQLWSEPAVTAMRSTFISGLRQLAKLMREPLSPDVRVGLDHTFTLRDTIHTTLENVRQQADAVSLEFGPARERNLALRSRILGWSLQLRIVSLARATLLRYRLHLPGFDLPPEKEQAQENFDNGMATILDAMADRLEGRPLPPEEPDPQALLAQFKAAIHQPSSGERPEDQAGYRQILLPLTERVAGTLTSLREEMISSLAGGV